MLKLCNIGTKQISMPYMNSMDSIQILPGSCQYITTEQAQYIKDKCPDLVLDTDYTIEVPAPVPSDLFDVELKILCDLQTNGTQIEFRAVPVFNELTGAYVSTRYATLADISVDYTPTGTVGVCKNKTVKSWEVCSPTGEKYMACMQVIDGVGQPASTLYLLPNGTSAGLTAGQIGLLEFCKALQKVAQVPTCDPAVTEDKDVDAINAVYLLNQKNFHTEIVYDVLPVTFGNSISYTLDANRTLTINKQSITLVGPDVSLIHWNDFGDGYSGSDEIDVHQYAQDGIYDVKVYYIQKSGNKILVHTYRINVVTGVPLSVTETVTRNYEVTIKSVLLNYCGDSLVPHSSGTNYGYNLDGTSYAFIGFVRLEPALIIDELEDNADYNPSKDRTATTITELGCANGVPYTRITGRRFDSNGDFLSEYPVWRDSNNAEVTTMPVGWTLGACPIIEKTEGIFSFTAVTTSGETLQTFMTNNSNDFNNSKVLSITIGVRNSNLYYITGSGPTQTEVLVNGVIQWGDGNDHTILPSSFNSFNLQSNTLVTVVWEQI